MDVREQYSYLKPQPVVWVAILGSAAMHLFLLGLLVLGGLWEESRTPLKDKAIITRLVRKGKKRPENWLPTKPTQPAPQAEPPKAVVPQPQAKKIPKSKNKRRRPKRSADYSKEMAHAFAALGNEVSDREAEGEEDGAIDGEALIAQKGDAYKTKIYNKISGYWEVPTLIPERERLFLNAVVVFTLDAKGAIKKLRFEKKSGNSLFDSAAARAVRRSAPFPPPPKELAKRYERDGIGIPFTASKK